MSAPWAARIVVAAAEQLDQSRMNIVLFVFQPPSKTPKLRGRGTTAALTGGAGGERNPTRQFSVIHLTSVREKH